MPMIKLVIVRNGEPMTYEIEATGALMPVAIGYQQLCDMRDRKGKPTKDLLDDIKAYEFILTSDEPEKFAKKYIDKKQAMIKAKGSYGIPVRAVAKELGWM